MNRRRFLGLIGAGVATAVAAPALKLLPAETLNVATIRQMKEQLVGRNIEPFNGEYYGEYADYANFSNMAIAAAIDDSVMKAAEELGYRAGLSVNALYQCYDANIPIRHAPRLAA